MIKINYASLNMAKSFGLAVKSVCEEKKYLSNSKGFSEEETINFVKKIIEKKYSQFYAIDKNTVIGWCDIIPKPQEFHSHVGILGTGLIKNYRNQGIGTKLIKKTIEYAKKNGIEKIELEVFESNTVAQKAYQKIGFEIEGIKRKSKKHNNKYENVIIMGLI